MASKYTMPCSAKAEFIFFLSCKCNTKTREEDMKNAKTTTTITAMTSSLMKSVAMAKRVLGDVQLSVVEIDNKAYAQLITQEEGEGPHYKEFFRLKELVNKDEERLDIRVETLYADGHKRITRLHFGNYPI